jgi:hypothetical protein
MNQHLINLVLALTAGELVHNVMESHQVRTKVEWLRLTLAGKKYKDSLPFEVDSRLKSYGLSFIGLVGFTAVFYAVFTWLDLSLNKALWTMVVLLLLAYIAVAYLLDKYHVEIGSVTDSLKRKQK